MDGLLTKRISSNELPLIIEPANQQLTLQSAMHLIEKNREALKKHLLKTGGLLFRHFPIASENDFARLIKTFGLGSFIDYIGGDSPRKKITDGIYTSTEAPPSVKIPLHNELSFVDHFPKHIYFYCQIPPHKDGETIIGDSRKILQTMSEKIRSRFKEKGLKYTSCYYHKSHLMDFVNWLQPSHKTWIDVFETKDKQEVERKCCLSNFGYKWNVNDWIQISQQRPATIRHPQTNEEVWFNQAHLFDFNPKLLGAWRYAAAKLFYCREHMKLHEVSFGDLTKIPREDIYEVMSVLDANTIRFPWQKGDVLVLDNMLAMHGRATFKGKRLVMTAMTS